MLSDLIKDTYAALLLKSVIPVRRPNVYSGGGRCVCKRCSGRSRGLYFSVLPARLLSGWENDRDTIFF